MKISRVQLIKIIREELAQHVVSLLEDSKVVDSDSDGEEKEKKGKKAETKPQNDPDNSSDKSKSASPKDSKPKADSDKSKSSDSKPSKPASKPTSAPSKNADIEPAASVTEPMGVSPEDDLEADADGLGIGDKVVGKSILSFTTNPDSPYVPGGMEITIAFRDDPTPLRILLGANGEARYVYDGGPEALSTPPEGAE